MDQDELPPDALEAVARCVAAVVDGQASASGVEADLYEWTRDYGDFGEVHLTMPPGPPQEWRVEAGRVATADAPTFWVVVDMWTREEGRSDLSLELEVRCVDRTWTCAVENLHVL